MKRLYIFDIDNTLRSSKQQKVLSQTIKLIKEIASNPDYVLGLATGRGPAKINVLNDLLPYFKYKVLVNGGVILENNKIIFDDPIDKRDIDKVAQDTMNRGFSMGMVGYDEEAITFVDEHVSYAFKGYDTNKPKVDADFYLNHKVYQLWVFNKDQQVLLDLAKSYTNFKPYLWHYGGIDLVYPRVSKEHAVSIIKQKYPEHELICVGDGHNDFGMIRLADKGVIMGNSRWLDEIKEEATFIAPHIEDDKLYDFFKENNLI
ncbi:HAD family hydrolase [Acholeplasma hippikon]|uniref:HAD family hydrolase/Cof-like hydrolase/yidA sugar phosphatase n=1 Tax=Acholeplasma hippikon TaxID=264636 RepID=A0A449BJQ3_9MOLU|nr:HAD family hydrolase [Acholeplasma hippikon]VEU82679.1 HAD family hydrolase/Cof-like hydrolase/yidA; sugar phosphatase [Acholeplasma hippikon]